MPWKRATQYKRFYVGSLGQWNCRFCLPSTARMYLQLPQEFFIILNYFHYLSLFLILRIETFKYTSNHQIIDIKSRTSLMYDGSVGICSVHSEIRESDMCKFENNGVTKKFSAKESPKMITECWTKVLMVEIKRKRFKDHFWSENR